jgi:hypothetical protein
MIKFLLYNTIEPSSSGVRRDYEDRLACVVVDAVLPRCVGGRDGSGTHTRCSYHQANQPVGVGQSQPLPIHLGSLRPVRQAPAGRATQTQGAATQLRLVRAFGLTVHLPRPGLTRGQAGMVLV